MHRVIFLMSVNLVFAVLLVQAQENAGCSAETEERNKELARKFYEKVWFSNDPKVVDEIFAPEYVAHDIGERKDIREPAEEQKNVAAFFWNNGEMSGTIDYQIAECDLVATRWQWRYKPNALWMKLLSGEHQIPIINVFRFENGKVVEIWNHRHDIDTLWGDIAFVKGLIIGLVPGLVLLIVSLVLWRKLRKISVR